MDRGRPSSVRHLALASAVFSGGNSAAGIGATFLVYQQIIARCCADEILGRVSAAWHASMQTALVVGMLISGPLLSVTSVPAAYLIAGTLAALSLIPMRTVLRHTALERTSGDPIKAR